MIWDRLFGSFVAERRDDPPRYGIVHSLGSFNPLRIALHEYYAIARDVLRRELTWLQRFAYFFGPPGWSHERSRTTTAQLRALTARQLIREPFSKVQAMARSGATDRAARD